MGDIGQSRLHLVEGLPGTGKSTMAQTLAKRLAAEGGEVALFLEGDLHPVDLQWISRMTPLAFDNAVNVLYEYWLRSPRTEPWSEIRQCLNDQSSYEDGYILTAYTRLNFRDVELWDGMDLFRAAEIHNGRISLTEYRDIYLRRWHRFAESRNHESTIYVFECAFFQSHISELLGHHLVDDEALLEFLSNLIAPVRLMRPEMHYVSVDDYAMCMCTTARSRGNWLADVINWVESSPYGKQHKLQGFESVLTFFRHREELEQIAMQRLGLPLHRQLRNAAPVLDVDDDESHADVVVP